MTIPELIAKWEREADEYPPIEGECRGIGRTRDEALERLAADVHNLYESLWA